MEKSGAPAQDAKKVFRQLGTCSRTLCHLLNREFSGPLEAEERAADPLAGGIMKKGYQCGMLWGASLAAGREAFETCAHIAQANQVAVEATRLLMDSFEKHENTTQCSEITKCDFNSNLSFAKYVLSGRFLHCFQLAEDWAPEAVRQAKRALEDKPHDFGFSMSCATETARKMGASELEMTMVAGFAGGLGLSGSGCGALSAALWMNALTWCRTHRKGSPIQDPKIERIMTAFTNFTDEKMLCKDIAQRRFNSLDDHTNYLKEGGCSGLITSLSQA